MGISTCSPSKTKYFGTPLPDLRPDLQSQANFGLEQTFKIFKNLKKHIPASGVYQGYSTIVGPKIYYSCRVTFFYARKRKPTVPLGSLK